MCMEKKSEAQIKKNFHFKAKVCLYNILMNIRRHFNQNDIVQKLQHYLSSDEIFLKKLGIGKENRASEKGGCLHTSGLHQYFPTHY